MSKNKIIVALTEMVDSLKGKQVALEDAPVAKETVETVEEKVEFMESTLTDGTIVKYDALEVGQPLIVVTSEGEQPAEDATHQFEDGTLVTTSEGMITEIVEGAPVETEDEMFSEFKALVDKLGLSFEQALEENKKLKEDNEALRTEFAEIKSTNEAVLVALEDVKKAVSIAEAKPAATPASQPRKNTIHSFKQAFK